MGIQLPQGGSPFMPVIPASIRALSPELNTYLHALEAAIIKNFRGNFNNDNTIVIAVNSGTSGTFNVASGGHIVVTSGVVISVSTT